MANLPERAIEIDGLRLGTGSPYAITKMTIGGKPEAALKRVARPRQDGLAFGRDYLSGRTISIELIIDTDNYDAARVAWSELATVWDAERVRTKPNSVVPMRIRQFDGETRWVVGRPNRIDPVDEELMQVGGLEVVADFDCIDHKLYSDQEFNTSLGIIPPSTGGMILPMTPPLVTSGRAAGEGSITVTGAVASWLKVLITGPIVNPVVTVTGQWAMELDLQLYAGEYVLVDPHPWSLSVIKNNTVNVAGKLTQGSPYLSEMLVPPGSHDITLTGADETGTASAVAAWRNSFLVP